MATQRSLKRICHDIAMVDSHRDALAETGIFYFPDESNIRRGLALLIGQIGTPYYGGFYYFSVEFPIDYPFDPIHVLSLTQDSSTRFNPNMYINGKVCLSILNTWHDGPAWSAIQNLESLLRVIMSDVLNANPLENEPAYYGCGKSSDALIYARRVCHANFYTAIWNMLTNPPAFATAHLALMHIEYNKRRESIIEHCKLLVEHDGKTEQCHVFSMTTTYTFRNVLDRLTAVKN